MTSSNSTSTTEEALNESHNSESKKHKSRQALYTDIERLKIIEEIYKRRFLWDTESRDSNNVSPAIRKQAFVEIADLIMSQTHNTSLTGQNIEQQFKNLKDTYVKIRKKHQPGVNGTTVMPKWRFYRLLQFLDSNEKIAKSYNLEKEMNDFHHDQRKSNKASASTSSPILTSESINANTSNPNQFNTVTISNGVIGTKPVNHHPQMIFNTIPSSLPLPTTLPPTPYTQSNQNRLKRVQNSQLTYVRHPVHLQQQQSNHNVEESNMSPQNSSAKEPRLMNSMTNGVMSNGTTPQLEDEYEIFCKSLIPSIREIGTHSKLDYLKLQKIIHDALFDIQSRIHTKNGK